MKSGTFWEETRHEFEAYVTDLDPPVDNAWKIVELYRKRAGEVGDSETRAVAQSVRERIAGELRRAREQSADGVIGEALPGITAPASWHVQSLAAFCSRRPA